VSPSNILLSASIETGRTGKYINVPLNNSQIRLTHNVYNALDIFSAISMNTAYSVNSYLEDFTSVKF